MKIMKIIKFIIGIVGLILELTLILFLGILEWFCKLFNKKISITIEGLD